MYNRSWKVTGLIATIVIVISIPLSWILNRGTGIRQEANAVFTGGWSCVECHQAEYRLWKGSDHDSAMCVASDSSVKGDFNNAEFTYGGKVSKFYKVDGKFFVFTEGPGGAMKEFQVAYTFGIRPLQQYLIPFEKGKYQCLPIAWDSRDKKWFHMAGMVYKPEDLKPDNWLYWTNQGQNWNGMCAECHSTNLQKNYNLATKSFHTTWTDINVNCEACHGPGSAHIEWARLPEMARPADNNAGLVVKTSKITSRQYVESCAFCHARRSSLGTYDHAHNEFLNNAIPQLIQKPYYFADGQILEEDYEYGSFTQSKMYMKDVRCGDCHDPHSLKRKFEGNALCTQCHRADEYDTYNHHLHKKPGEKGNSFARKDGTKVEVGDGALCRNCHMPGRYYMGIDLRFDHSLRIPRPDLSITLGTPNACNQCHDDKTAQWSLQYVNKWYGDRKKPHYATLLADAADGKAGADEGLLRMISSNLYPEIIRATAIEDLSAFNSKNAEDAMKKAINDPDPLIRYAAVRNYSGPDSADLFRTLSPLLNNGIKAVRMEAAMRLASFNRNIFNEIQFRSFQKGLDEYRIAMEYVADFPSGSYNLGNFYASTGDNTKAEESYKEAILTDNLFYPAKVNLALLYYRQGKMDPAEGLFKDLVVNHPDLMDGYYYLGLLYGEEKRYNEAIVVLEKATTKTTANTRIYYNLGLLYQMTRQDAKCEAALQKGLELAPCDFDLLYALYDFQRKQNNMVKATIYIEKLKRCYPDNKQIKGLYDEFMKRKRT